MTQGKLDQLSKRQQDRLREAIQMAIKSREFSTTELIEQADDLISFSIAISRQKKNS
jgi:hypothetical protein